ncbi:MAG: protein BatD, partial [Bacteroidaceae bacterium]|nr:protein BatD [Bacteroidaceae bacterium]
MKRLFVLYCFCLVAIGLHAQTFTAKAPDQVEEGEVFRIQFVVTTDSPSAFKGPDFDAEGFEVLAGPYTSRYSSYQIINGKSTSNSSVTYTYTVSAGKKGKYTIPEATVTVGGKKLTTKPLSITIVAGTGGGNNGGNNRSNGSNGNSGQVQMKDDGRITSSDLFITATASKSKVHEQEAILLTYKVYTLVNLTSLQPKMPDLKGFHVQEIELPRNKVFTTENYKGRMYNTVVWSQYVLFPQQTGKMTIPSITFEGVVAQRVRSMDPLDAFFNTGSSFTEVEKKIQTPAIEITVEPLPTKPANYSGAVGTFTMKSEVSPAELKTGEAMTMKISISGKGNMKLM